MNWKNRLGTADGVRYWHFYSYEYLDDLTFMRQADEVLGGWPEKDSLISAVKNRFSDMGWDGDGEIQIMWLPSFVGAGPDNNFGCYAFHVKQLNDGNSWIGSPYSFPFHRLFEPSDSHYLPAGRSTMESSSWRTGATEWNTKFIGALDSELSDENS
ncbi:hypothetical protein ONV78_28875 [Hahella sp. CR1]|uniref:hypothetical protein n=1 Tax=Hahella sp. CR1 TaxID=2992807 RepID=UPI0024432F06|nr:hypothetical protein [Hahella sp. CR1]MDG9671784.1 hypothetical protein [Hahella sp. CR1]